MAWTLDHALLLDVRSLVRSGLQSGISRWFRGETLTSSIAFAFDGRRSLTLSYRTDGEQVDESFNLTSTRPHFGGLRWWVVCRGCGRRVGVLYSARGRFRCRRCVGLPYRSQHESPFARACDAMRRDLAKLGAGPSILDTPSKPKRMRWSTYEAICDRIDARFARVAGAVDAFHAESKRRGNR